ncbi:hypothetical protein [Maribacter antarcticus]|uniref:hypothetical protein n=1 Tax=Maribacter antarcticus TaxID=505250 RepID=UPI0004795D62|nr:hypothetical protein [Maribacter antarcticus]
MEKSTGITGMACLLAFGSGYIKPLTRPIRNAELGQYQKVCVFLEGLLKQFDLRFITKNKHKKTALTKCKIRKVRTALLLHYLYLSR